MMPKHPFQSVKGMWQVGIGNKRISGKPNVIMRTSLKAENKLDITPCLSGTPAAGSCGAALQGAHPDLGEGFQLEHSRQDYSLFCRVCFEQGLILYVWTME